MFKVVGVSAIDRASTVGFSGAFTLHTQTPKLIVYPMSGGGSSGKNYYGFGKEKGGRKGDPIIWEGPLGPDSFPEPVFEFPPQHKSDFTNETPL